MNMTPIKKLTALVFVFLMLTSFALAQVGPEVRIVAEQNGLLIVGPASGQHFQMRITGENVARMRSKKKYWFTANGICFEFFSEENSKFLITDIPYALDDKAVLKLYLAGFIHRNGDPTIDSKFVRLTNGKTALFWSYDKFVASPESTLDKEREIFLVLTGPGHVFGLFAPVSKRGTELETRKLLTRVLGTLTFIE